MQAVGIGDSNKETPIWGFFHLFYSQLLSFYFILLKNICKYLIFTKKIFIVSPYAEIRTVCCWLVQVHTMRAEQSEKEDDDMLVMRITKLPRGN